MNEKKPTNPWAKSLLIWVGILFGLVVFVQMIGGGSKAATGEAIPYSEFVRQVDEQNVQSVTTSATASGNQVITGKLANGQNFRTTAPADAQVTERLIQKGVQVQAKEAEQSSFWLILLYQSLPFLLILGISFFVMRQMQKNAGSGAMGFGKSRARMLTEKQGRVTFADVAGIDEAREELQEIVEFLKDPGRFARLGGKIPKGALLVGSPGTGKTLLARAIAGEAGVPFFTISGSDFVEMFVGVGASRVRDMFDQAKKSAPCIVFIDEIDAVGRHRGAGLGNGNDEREQTLNQLLVEMDGFEANEGIIIIAATNRPDVLDPALLRPGRFDRQVVVPRPDIDGREQILAVHMKKVPLAPDVDPRIIARGTPGFSGADLANLVNEAALLAARKGKRLVAAQEFEEAKDKVHDGHRAQVHGHDRGREAHDRLSRGRACHRRSSRARFGPDPQGDDHPARPSAGHGHAPAGARQLQLPPRQDVREPRRLHGRPRRRGIDLRLRKGQLRRVVRHQLCDRSRSRHGDPLGHVGRAWPAAICGSRRGGVPRLFGQSAEEHVERDRSGDRQGNPPYRRAGI